MTGEFKSSYGEGRLEVHGHMTVTSDGIVLQLYGGTHAHVGGVVISSPVPSQKDPGKMSASSAVYNFPSHKEELVARPAAERIAAAAGVPAVCVAGIHVDDAGQDDIRAMVKNAEAVVDALIKYL